MARYIDVEPLEDKLKEHIRKTESELMLGALSTFLRLLDITPTADVAPIVRCESCKHFKRQTESVGLCESGFCNAVVGVAGIDFCCFGERKDNE